MMGRTRRSWGWVGDYPVFVYTNFITDFEFRVRIVIGEKNNQNALGYGPTATPDLDYVQTGLQSKDQVFDEALIKAHEFLGIEKVDWGGEEVILPENICEFCGACQYPGEEMKHHASCDPNTKYEYN